MITKAGNFAIKLSVMGRLDLVLLMACIGINASASSKQDRFAWGNATVYFVITDRFCNGDQSNDVNYGRKVDYGSEQLNAATFHGGDFKGMTVKAREGYFKELGVDVVWMTDVYEQIHGYMSGSGPVNDFPHYGYHGYYPLDYTQIDKNYGTVAEFRELVDTLHAQGIRVMLGANLNDPGYPTLLDAVQLGFAPTGGITEAEAVEHDSKWSFDDWNNNNYLWADWWTSEWIRTNDENWSQNDPLTATLYGMPDFKTEKETPVKIPKFLRKKWEREGDRNAPWVNPSALSLRNDRNWSPMDYVIAWIASWVEEFGIDGFRCDIVENVHLYRWRQLNEACNLALERWRNSHHDDPTSKWDDKFYMTGDFEYASIDYKSDYADAGFSSMVNFYFPKHGDLDGIVYTWQAYSDSVAAHPGWHPFNYLNNSYWREADMDNMEDCGTTLLLSPGVAQIFYGDETRRGLSDAQYNVDSDQAFRSDMNWDSIDNQLQDHFQMLGRIRHDHPVIGAGRQTLIDNFTCVRQDEKETIVIRVRPNVDRPINIAGFIPDGTKVIDLCTGICSMVKNGGVSFPEYKNRVSVITAL